MSEHEVREIPIQSIRVDPRKRRDHADVTAARDMANSIREVGLITPVSVRPAPADGEYILVCGAVRLAAYAILGRGTGTIPAFVSDLSEDEAEAREIAENLVRWPLTVSERDAAVARYSKLMHSLYEKDEADWRVRKDTGLNPDRAAKAVARHDLRQDPVVREHARKLGLLNLRQPMDAAAREPDRASAIASLDRSARQRRGHEDARRQAERRDRREQWRTYASTMWEDASDEDRAWFLREVVGEQAIRAAGF